MDIKYNSPKQIGIASDLNGHDILKRVYSTNGKSPTLNSMGGGNREPKIAIKGGAIRGRYDDAGKLKQKLELRKDEKSNAITTVSKDSIAVRSFNIKDGLGKKLNKAYTLNFSDWRGLNRKQNQNALAEVKNNQLRWRRLTALECERLQTVPDNYTEGVSNTQRYKMLGNGMTVKVIEHILKNMEKH